MTNGETCPKCGSENIDWEQISDYERIDDDSGYDVDVRVCNECLHTWEVN